MRIPAMSGVIERRILANYRVEEEVLAPLLPAPFRPKRHRGFGIVGICLIRLRDVRPAGMPARLGVGSENAAHRVAVEWDDETGVREGVYIRRRDTSSWLNALAGGRVFPGIHSHARFEVNEERDHLDVALLSDDGVMSVSISGDVASSLPRSSVFASLEEASRFFQGGALGYSATPDPCRFQGLELRTSSWNVEPLAVSAVSSSVFDDRSAFPAGSIEFDCALLMRDIQHEWHGRADLVHARAGRTDGDR